MLILGIESSCDETAFSLVEDGTRVLSNAIASQIELHQRFGGVVPEIASRAHLECIVPLMRQALETAGCTMADVDAVAVTRGPGLAGCLLVGVEYAKGLALRHGKPLIAVHHIAGHLYSPAIGRETNAWGEDVSRPVPFGDPYLGLAISGGHSSLILVKGPADFEILGETLDDAVGEAYDKVAKVLGLGYPGGPLLDQAAAQGDPKAFDLPRPVMHTRDYNFSFSGLKTAVARLVEQHEAGGHHPLGGQFVAGMAASFQEAVIDVLVKKTGRALKQTGLRRLALTGGVACNRGLRAAVANRLPKVKIAIPEPEYCTDNAAMIAGLGFHLAAETPPGANFGMNAAPSLALVPAASWRDG